MGHITVTLNVFLELYNIHNFSSSLLPGIYVANLKSKSAEKRMIHIYESLNDNILNRIEACCVLSKEYMFPYVYANGIINNRYPFIVYECIEGQTLNDINIMNLSSKERKQILMRLIILLYIANKKSFPFIHNDLSPSNIIIHSKDLSVDKISFNNVNVRLHLNKLRIKGFTEMPRDKLPNNILLFCSNIIGEHNTLKLVSIIDRWYKIISKKLEHGNTNIKSINLYIALFYLIDKIEKKRKNTKWFIKREIENIDSSIFMIINKDIEKNAYFQDLFVEKEIHRFDIKHKYEKMNYDEILAKVLMTMPLFGIHIFDTNSLERNIHESSLLYFKIYDENPKIYQFGCEFNIETKKGIYDIYPNLHTNLSVEFIDNCQIKVCVDDKNVKFITSPKYGTKLIYPTEGLFQSNINGINDLKDLLPISVTTSKNIIFYLEEINYDLLSHEYNIICHILSSDNKHSYSIDLDSGKLAELMLQILPNPMYILQTFFKSNCLKEIGSILTYIKNGDGKICQKHQYVNAHDYFSENNFNTKRRNQEKIKKLIK